MCNETQGDCFKFATKYLNFKWLHAYCVSPIEECENNWSESH